MTVLTHHPCGPSQLYKRQACPGSLRMEARLPDIPSSSDAERGTNLHDAIDKPQQDDEMSLFDLKQVKVVREAMDEYGQECEWRYEVPFTIKIPFCEDRWGTADCVGKIADVGIILDAKFGDTPVTHPSMNLQVMDYALGYLQADPSINKVIVVIIQPMLRKKEHHYFVWLRRQQDEMESKIAEILNACHAKEWRLHAGSHCSHCRASAICPVFHAFAERPALEDGDLVEMYNRQQTMTRAAKTIKALVESQVDHKVGEPGKGLIWHERVGNREVDLPEFLSANEKILDLVDILPIVKVGIGDLEKVFANQAVKRGISRTKAAAKQILNDSPGIFRGPEVRTLKPWVE